MGPSYSQDTLHISHEDSKPFGNAVAFSLGVIALPQFDLDGEHIGEVFLPAFSLDYELWYNRKFGFLFMNEYVLSSFVARDHLGDFIEREHILISAIALGYSPFDHLAGFIGFGMEIDLGNGITNNVLKMGMEYSIPIRNHWHSVLLLTGDFREYYGSASFEIGFAKEF
jgi:hypothetical protein